MRYLAPLLLGSLLATADVSIGQWNGMLLVTAPAGDDLRLLGGRLDQRITLDVRDQPLTDTVDQLRGVTGLNFIVAPALLARPPAITLQVRDMRLGHVFTWLQRVGGFHIGYQHGAVYIGEEAVAGPTSTRIYDVSDLTLPVRDFPGPELSVPMPGGNGTACLPPPEAETGDPGRYDLDQLTELLNRHLGR